MKQRKACVIYVESRADALPEVEAELHAKEYVICATLVDDDTAIVAQAGGPQLPPEVVDCLDGATLCIFLLPETCVPDGTVVATAGAAGSKGTPVIAIGTERTELPTVFDDIAKATVISGSGGIKSAIKGEEVWEIKGKVDPKMGMRTIVRQRCQ